MQYLKEVPIFIRLFGADIVKQFLAALPITITRRATVEIHFDLKFSLSELS